MLKVNFVSSGEFCHRFELFHFGDELQSLHDDVIEVLELMFMKAVDGGFESGREVVGHAP